jgi:malonyl CoA-acyl carrier protein transacylase/NADP-dependent 3-hydroxy acid dehydrogenase YdfG
VSSFGISGTNAHLILEQGESSPRHGPAIDDRVVPLIVSARTAGGLPEQAARLASFLEEDRTLTAATVARDLLGRSGWEHRAVVIAGDRATAAAGLAAVARGEPAPGVVTGVSGPLGKTVWVFPGQGAQWLGMGRELWQTEPVFAARMSECEQALAPWVDWSLYDIVTGDDPAWLDRVDVVQPVTFAVMVSLAALWQAAGVTAEAVVGHSQGELAAACVAGALTLQDAARIVARRSQLIAGHLAGHGGMLSVAASEDRVRADLAGSPGVEVAVVNGPEAVVLAGDPGVLAGLRDRYEADGVRARLLPVDYASHTSHVSAIADELTAVLGDAPSSAPRIPWYSTAGDGGWITQPVEPDYWYRNLRERVGFASAVHALGAAGFTTLIEISSHPVLIGGIHDTLGQAGVPALVGATLRRDDGGRDRWIQSLAELSVRGLRVDWAALLPEAGHHVGLPTYAFQREHFWLTAQSGGDPARLGLEAVEHPLVGAVIETPDTAGVTLTGRLSLSAHPWLADHVVDGVVLVPGVTWVELALQAGDRVGLPVLAELIVEAPLRLAEDDTVRVQVVAGELDPQGRRPVSVHSRPGTADFAVWSRHATGYLTEQSDVPTADSAAEWAGSWPPAGAEAIDSERFYDHASRMGFSYGPMFQGVRTAWQVGDDLFAEVVLPEPGDTDGYLIHPALLDAALHPVLIGQEPDGEDGSPLPFAWLDVAVHATAARSLRVKVTPRADGLALQAVDSTGTLVASIGAVVFRKIAADRLRDSGRELDNVFQIDWTQLAPAPVATPAGSVLVVAGAEDLARAAADGVSWLVLPVAPAASDIPERQRIRVVTERVLRAVQAYLAEPDWASARLVAVTHNAVQTAPDDVVDPAQAAVWGLLRSAQAENPDRIVLVDGDTDPRDAAAVVASRDESQLAIRAGGVWAPRLARAVRTDVSTDPREPVLDPTGTVLITGGTGTLGMLVARHLVTAHGVRNLLLASRRGPDAPGAAEVTAELERAGAVVEVAACDVADLDQVRALLDRVPGGAPLTAVIHTAGVMDDGVVAALDGSRLDRVLAPKVDAALHLDELTRGRKLAAFVLFSSIAGVLGGPGQGNYAAANAALDAIAARRHLAGEAGVSVAWGLWAETSGVTADLSDTDRTRLSRSGVLPVATAQALGMLDAVMTGVARPAVVAARFDLPTLRSRGAAGAISPLLRTLVGPTRRAAALPDAAVGLADRLAGLGEPEQLAVLTDLVRAEVAVGLGFSSPDAIDPDRAFRDLGFDSLTAVELRNRLAADIGRPLAATLVYDHENPAAAAAYLLSVLDAQPGTRAPRPVATADRTLNGTYRALAELGRIDEMQMLVVGAVALRPTFGGVAELGEGGLRTTRLSYGDELPHLICFPPLLPVEGVMQYSRLAQQFDGAADLTVVRVPGYEDGEPLSVSVDVLAEALGDAAARSADGRPFVLLGVSSGGLLAHAVATRLEADGYRPEGVVLLDTILPGPESRSLAVALNHELVRRAEHTRFSDSGITAAGHYFQMFYDWQPGPLAAPTLQLRPTEGLPGTPEAPLTDQEWRSARWPVEHTATDVPGNHFTMAVDHADQAARAIRDWLSSVAVASAGPLD